MAGTLSSHFPLRPYYRNPPPLFTSIAPSRFAKVLSSLTLFSFLSSSLFCFIFFQLSSIFGSQTKYPPRNYCQFLTFMVETWIWYLLILGFLIFDVMGLTSKKKKKQKFSFHGRFMILKEPYPIVPLNSGLSNGSLTSLDLSNFQIDYLFLFIFFNFICMVYKFYWICSMKHGLSASLQS